MTVVCCLAMFMANAKNADVQESFLPVKQVEYTLHLNSDELSCDQGLTFEQKELIDESIKKLRMNIKRLQKMEDSEKQQMLQKYLYINLNEVRDNVSKLQYRSYLQFLNDEFNRTGLTAVLFGYAYNN